MGKLPGAESSTAKQVRGAEISAGVGPSHRTLSSNAATYCQYNQSAGGATLGVRVDRAVRLVQREFFGVVSVAWKARRSAGGIA